MQETGTAEDKKRWIAERAAREIRDGELVNLGIGLPTMAADFISDRIQVSFQSENGMTGMGPRPVEGREDKEIINAGGQSVTVMEGGMFFDSAFSFALIRGGHVDVSILGGLQVDSKGNLANWMVPGKSVPGMGGAMDLLCGVKRVIVTMLHTKNGEPKLKKCCTLPLTAAGAVDTVITELGVFDIEEDGFVLREPAEGVTLEEIQKQTDAPVRYHC